MNEQQKEQYQKTFTENFKNLLQMNGKNQQDIVKDLGFSKSAVSSWYSGTRMPKIPTVDQLAIYFGVNRSDLIGERFPGTNNFPGEEVYPHFVGIPDTTKIIDYVVNALENGNKEEFYKLQQQYKAEKEKTIKDKLRTIESLSEEDVDQVYKYICELQSTHRSGKEKLTAVFRPQNANQPHKVRNKNEER